MANEAVEIMDVAQLGTEMSDEEAGLIAELLGALTGEQPKVEYPILPAETADMPKPVL